MIITRACIEDAPAMAELQAACWQQSYAHYLQPDELAGLSSDAMRLHWQQLLSQPEDSAVFLVARDASGKLTGLVAAGAERKDGLFYDAEIYEIDVAYAQQRKGIGRQLFLHAAQALAQSGFHALLAWVPEGHPGQHFFTAMGGSAVAKQQAEMGRSLLTFYAYGWEDLRLLL